MSLPSGTRIGCYEVVSVIGAGGMGEVYRARDTKLGRDVALKVLPELFAGDAERLARFQREAQLLASLNHPNIGIIHGLEDAGVVRALVLELVEGETLADRIRRGPLPVGESVAAARQIAEALEAAHERGVIHRDLKPANVKITPDGKVKVLDFGLAKAMDSAPSSPHVTHSPTLSLAGTLAGMVLGTAAYMSPEQAKGLPADQRSDVFSFGCVLYEMLAGRQAFQADTAAESMAAVLMRTPDLSALPAALSPRVRALVQRCLEKDPKRRWQAIGDVRFELEAIAVEPEAATLVAPSAAKTVSAARPLWRRVVPSALAAVAAAAVASAATWWIAHPRVTPIVTRFSVPIVDEDPMRLVRSGADRIVVAPDGASLVYVSNRQLYRRAMAEVEAHPISGTNLDPVTPFFSPDGQWIGFYSTQDGTLKKVPAAGGIPTTLCKSESGISGASWGDRSIVFVQPGKGIMRVSADGGDAALVVPAGAADVLYGPQILPNNRGILFTVTTASGVERWDKGEIVVQAIGSPSRKTVVRGGSAGRYLDTGHLMYAVAGTVVAVPFDLAKLEATRGPVPVIESVGRAANPAAQSGVAHFAVSASGTLAYLTGQVLTAGPKKLALVDRTGRLDPLDLPPQAYIHPRLSHDGGRLVVGTDDGREANVWVYDMRERGALRRLTFSGRNQFPIWTPDSRSITFQSNRDGDQAIFRQPADGSGVPERLTKPDQGAQHEPESWHPDGQTLSLNLVSGTSQGIWLWSAARDRKLEMFVDTPTDVEKHSVFSPDGKWIAYLFAHLTVADGQPATAGVFAEPFPRTGAKYQVAAGGARAPLFSPDGKQLFYHDTVTNRLVVVDIRTDHGFAAGTPTPLPIENTIHPIAQRNYDLTPDGKRLLVVLPATAAGDSTRTSAPQINIVQNWTEELKARVPVK